MIEGDSAEYEFLTKAVELSKDVDGLCIECGLRLGFGTKTIIDAIAEFCTDKVAVAVDPYGHIPFEHREGVIVRLDYTETMKNTCLGNMYPYAQSKGVKFRFWELEDTEFFKRFADGVPIYSTEKSIVNKYSLVHYDGPHGVDAIKLEVDFFNPRTPIGGTWVFDDATPDFYDHDQIDKYVKNLGFQLIEHGNKKALYQKQ